MTIEERDSARVWSRREALAFGGAGAVSVLLAACSSTANTSTGSSGAAGGTGTTRASAGSGTTTGTAAPVVLDDATMKKLDDVLAQGMKAMGVPGVSIGVWWPEGKLWRRTVGIADLQTNAPYQANDLARIASITKTYTATAVLQLVDAKKLSLSDTLETFVPGIANGNTITIENLLGMTSGIFDFTADQAFVTKFDADPTMPWTLEQTIEIIKANQPLFEPGTKVQYCDSNYVLLGTIVEKVTGKTLGEVITSEIIGKLGFENTSYPTTAVMPTPHPTAYLPDISGAADPKKPFPFDNAAKPPKVANDVNPAVSAGAGAMISTVDELKLWAEELANGTLLSKETQAKRLDTKFMTGQTVAGYGLGVLKIGSLIGHNGSIIGYSSIAMHYPAAGATFVAVTNESNNFTGPATEIVLAIVKALYPQALAS